MADEVKEPISPEVKKFTTQEVKELALAQKTALIIDNCVYDVTEFLNEHPGGEEVLLEQAGNDATEPFEDVGHSSEAREMMLKYKIGELVESERKSTAAKSSVENPKWTELGPSGSSFKDWLAPLALAIVATLLYGYFRK